MSCTHDHTIPASSYSIQRNMHVDLLSCGHYAVLYHTVPGVSAGTVISIYWIDAARHILAAVSLEWLQLTYITSLSGWLPQLSLHHPQTQPLSHCDSGQVKYTPRHSMPNIRMNIKTATHTMGHSQNFSVAQSRRIYHQIM